MSLLKSSALIGVFTLLSRILGFGRDLLMAAVIGASAISDAFFVALRLPNLFRQLFAEGAFNVAFVPMLARRYKDGQTQAEVFAGGVFTALMVVVSSLTVLGMIFMPTVVMVVAPGFHNTPDIFNLAVDLSRISFPYLVFIVYVSFMGGVLNTMSRFAAAAIAPTLLNLSFILLLGTAYLKPGVFSQPVMAPTWAIPLGGIMQALLLWVAIRRSGFKVQFHSPKATEGIGTLLKRLVPTTIGVGAQQINTLISTLLASFLPASSISYLFYADRLNQLPLGLIGIAIATALLPTLSRAFREGSREASDLFEQGIVVAMLLGFAAATGLVLLANEIMLVLFQRGAFSVEAAHASGAALVAFSLGLPAYILIKITNAAFYAAEDTRTPLHTALVSIAVNLVLNIILMQFLQHVGLALATAIAAWTNLVLQVWILSRRKLFKELDGLKLVKDIGRVIACTLALALPICVGKTYWTMPIDTLPKLFWLLAMIGVPSLLWLGMVYLCGLHRFLPRRVRKVR